MIALNALSAKPKKGAGVKQQPKRQRPGAVVEKPEEEVVMVSEDGLTVSEMAAKLGKNPAGIITYFFAEKGMPLTVNSVLNRDLIEQVSLKYGVEILFDDEKASVAANRGILAEEHEDAEPRPPVVTVMGHVDHGKTTLLDTIRKRSVAATEAGGITQRIGAYTVQVGDEKATFIDTPGHEAFTAMRARGAQVTDIAVLVVAADDGVMPQTREAIAHAKAAEVPIIVAINKIDVPNADADNARQKLAEEDVIPEEWGGPYPMVECSAKKNIGIDNLLEIITLTAQVAELKAPYGGHAAGVILESSFDAQRGSLATLLVQRGTLRVGDCGVAGTKVCKVRAMLNEAGQELGDCPPSTAVQVIGFSEPPEAGDQWEVVSSITEARALAESRMKAAKTAGPVGAFAGNNNAIKLALILKCDSQGSIAAVKYMFEGMRDSKHVNLRWVLAAPGPVVDSDVELAASCPKDSRVMVVAFNSKVMASSTRLAKQRGIQIKEFKVIYELFETIVANLENEIAPEEQLVERGRAQVLATFDGRDGKVCGCRVEEGQLKKGNRVKFYRRGKKVGEGNITSLRQGKEAVIDADEGNECGFSVDGFEDFNAGDEVHCFEASMINPKLVQEKKKIRNK